MSEKLQDLKPRTKAFALRVIRMYSKLPKNDTVTGFQPANKARACANGLAAMAAVGFEIG